MSSPELWPSRSYMLGSWEITTLKGPRRWTHYALYAIIDVFSRFVVGWTLADCESFRLAHALINTTCHRQGIRPDQLVIHSDRGSPMTSTPVVQLLNDLREERSFTRPYTSNDNPYPEAQFKTMKYRPTYPRRFGPLEDAKAWANGFCQW